MRRPKIATAGKRRWKVLQPEARRMRKEPTDAEGALWQVLRGGALGMKFRRQHAIGRFIVDFFCVPASLIIELDGGSHDGTEVKDRARDHDLRQSGYTVIRFRNDEVLQNIGAVLETIGKLLRATAFDPLSPWERGVTPKA